MHRLPQSEHAQDEHAQDEHPQDDRSSRTARDGDPRRRTGLAYLFLAIVMLLWAGNSIVGRAVRSEIPPFTLSFVRWTGALMLMSPFALPAVRRDQAMLRAHWPIIVLLGLCGVASFNAFLYLGLHSTTATNAILIQAAIPPLILLADFVLFRQKAPALQVAGVLLSTLGVVLIVTHADLAALLGLSFGRGDIYVFCAVIGWALYTSLLRKRPPIEPLSFLASTFLIAALAMLPLAVWEWMDGQRVIFTAGTFGAFVYVAVLPSLVGYLLYNSAVAMIGAGRAGQTIGLMPLFGAVLAAALLDEPLHAYHYVGMGFLLVGICLAALTTFDLLPGRPSVH